MTRTKKVKCNDIKKLLDLELTDSRPDRASISAHLKSCQRCCEHAPELAWLYGHLEVAQEKESSKRRQKIWRAASCAAVLLVAVTIVRFAEFGTPNLSIVDDISTFAPPNVAPTRILPEHFSTIEVRSTSMQPENSVSSSTVDGVGSLGSRHQARNHEMEWIR